MEDRFYSVRNGWSLIDKMREIYSKGENSIITDLSIPLGRNPNGVNRLGIFSFEGGIKSAVVNERYFGVLIPAIYNVDLFLTGENPNDLRAKLESDLRVTFSNAKSHIRKTR
jgi:hypothetical protein